ncbi:alpha/beta hydrolase [Aureispira sp. CCB-E]|uniref:alpha/beta fold hydrolase n=1 Tax=Aureispira sp. CCB-E TaxID=3051121 RepID=UPI0028696CD8|nr:alpha/beta hydrolase [Aureispira sp. CCB-E]WMX13265.1 alpha/beta hydrolase [Aureispira sp. CCB-E]
MSKLKKGKDYKVASTKYGLVRFTEIGPKNGEVILFSTGGGASFMSVHAFEWLVAEGFRVIAINRPGYFDLPIKDSYTLESHADIYHEVINYLGVKDKIHVFGVSMGGLSALYYAQKYPTQSLVLWSSVSGKYCINEQAANSGLGRLVLSKSGKNIISWLLLTSAKLFPKKTIETFLKTEADLDRQERILLAKQIVQNQSRKKEFMTFVKSMTPMGALYEGMMDEVAKAANLQTVDWTNITCPTFAVHSIVDIDVSIEHAQRLEKMIPAIKMMYVRAGGHFVWWGEEGEQVKHATKDFLLKVTSIQ